MKCNKCGYDLKDDAIFCTKCGDKQWQESRCSPCGHDLSVDDRFCSKCGATQEFQSSQKERTYEKTNLRTVSSEYSSQTRSSIGKILLGLILSATALAVVILVINSSGNRLSGKWINNSGYIFEFSGNSVTSSFPAFTLVGDRHRPNSIARGSYTIRRDEITFVWPADATDYLFDSNTPFIFSQSGDILQIGRHRFERHIQGYHRDLCKCDICPR
jgi:hypothetical protein